METLIVNIDSRFRNKTLYPNPGSFVYNFSKKIKNCNYIKLSSIELPNLYFTFTTKKQNTFFKIIENSKTHTITINEGMYAYDQLLLAIQDKFNIINTANATDFTIIFSQITGYVAIESNNTFIIDFNNDSDILESLGFALGFINKTYTSIHGQLNDAITHYIKSESQLDSLGDHYLFLKINDYGVIINDYQAIQTDTQTTQIIKTELVNQYLLAKIMITEDKSGHIFNNSSDFITKAYIFRQPTDISKLKIDLVDPRGNIIDLLYMNYSLTLELNVII
jgi:hypothetical protein